MNFYVELLGSKAEVLLGFEVPVIKKGALLLDEQAQELIKAI